MVKTYVDEGGVENVAVGIIKQTRKDFIKGAKILYGRLHRIPEYDELGKYTGEQDIRWMWDAWRFVIENPYNFFEDMETVINAWKSEAIEEHYKVLYLKGAETLYINHAPKKIYDLPDEEIIKLMNDNQLAADFIKAKNYIYKLPEGEKILRSWNVIAYARSKHPIRKKTLIQDTRYSKEQSEKRQNNITRAKEMYEEGMSIREIAWALEVTVTCVRAYLRS